MPTQEECEFSSTGPRRTKVVVCLAPRSQPFDESIDSLNAMIATARNSGFVVEVIKVRRGAPGWHNAGPALAFFLKDQGATHLFLAADDMLYPADCLLRLVGDDKDVVCGVYRKNRIDQVEFANSEPEPDKILEKFTSRGLHETLFASGHTMTIKRHVIEKMVQDYPELHYDQFGEVHYGLFLPMVKDRRAFQDDWAFSIRARQSGFTLWNDYGCRMKHYCSEFMGIEAD